MNRKIKFRGISIFNDEWLYGNIIKIEADRYCILPEINKMPMGKCIADYEVYNDTIDQFTGLHDKNGKEIYEGDILTADHYPFMKDGKMNYLAVVEWFEEDACWYASEQLHKDSTASGISVNCPAEFDKVAAGLYKVTGNIHDNIDLLKDYEK